MELIENNLNDEVLSLLTNPDLSKSRKKSLFVQNVVLSFVGKLVLPKITVRATLPHRPTGIDVCVIVKDLKKTDYDASNTLWKTNWQRDLASFPDASKLPTVTFLPVSELKLAYQSFEARRKLASTFDVFLADKRIVHHLPTNLGKAFYQNSTDKVPVPVTLEGKNLAEAVQGGLRTCLVLMKGNGTTQSVIIGNVEMAQNDLRDNILSVARDVLAKWPGGVDNVRSVYVRGVGPSVPIFYDNANASKDAAQKSLDDLKNKKNSTQKELVINKKDATARVLAGQMKRSNSKLPMAAVLEVAKTLPLSLPEIKKIFAAPRKSKKQRKSLANSSKKPLQKVASKQKSDK